MKNFLLFSAILLTIGFGASTASAQCNPTYESPIKCSYYDEGYRDGASDANNSFSNDYRRYKSKYTKQYESYYRNGYQAGYGSVYQGGGSTGGGYNWSNSQRNAYDLGYNTGQNDRNRSQNRNSQSYGNYDANIGLYFQAGYNDGYNGVQRRYNFPIGNNNPGWPGNGGGGTSGTGSWSGRVDDRANIIIRGGSITAQDVSGTGLQIQNQYLNGSLPFRASTVTATRRQGRGSVNVIQQPNRFNNFTAIIQIIDSKSGQGDYQVDIRWTGAGGNVEEPYQSGNVYWRGRVDQKANIIINGSDVQSQDDSATGLSGVSFNINGYLAHRPGTVTARKRSGRGSVYILQQPSWQNDFTAIIQVFDPNGGADNYEVEISW